MKYLLILREEGNNINIFIIKYNNWYIFRCKIVNTELIGVGFIQSFNMNEESKSTAK